MRLFTSRAAADRAPVPDLAATAAASGWRPAPDPPVDRDLYQTLHGVILDMYGVGRGIDYVGPNVMSGRVAFRDAFCFDDAGRPVTVANAHALLAYGVPRFGKSLDVALCAIQLPALLHASPVYSRLYHLRLHLPSTPTGNPLFDERYAVVGMPFSVGPTWLTPQVQQLILAHDDWVLLPFGTTLACVTKGPFTSADEVVRRVRDVLALVAAIPTSIVPARADHSVDDLAARIAGIDSMEQALAFLLQLSDADRERLARSDTPLADFADVRSPEEAMLRLQSMDLGRRAQLLALFNR
jgi:hypothetical protein